MWMLWIEKLNQLLTLGLILPVLIFLGLYLTLRLRGIQFTQLKRGLKHLLQKDDDSEGNISNFQALSAVLAGNLGTGNISGMAIALALGGPGALVWMWMMALLGTVIKYTGCFLGLKYRTKNAKGEYVGGPMYYLSKGLNFKKTAIVFSLAAILTSFTVGNLVQVNSIFLPLKTSPIQTEVFLAVLILLTSFLLFGGLKRIANLLGTLVPIMTLIYLVSALGILGLYRTELLPALHQMFHAAFSLKAAFGAGMGYTLFQGMKSGLERGIFATDAGLGIAPILQSSARCKKPIDEGIVAMVAPFIVMIICTVTGLVLMVTGAWNTSGEVSTNMCIWAFNQGLNHSFGGYVVLISLVLFAFTTIITWAYCGEKAIEYLGSTKWLKIYRLVFLLLLPVGAYTQIYTVWVLADISIALMLLCNLVGIFGLSKQVIQETDLEFKSAKVIQKD